MKKQMKRDIGKGSAKRVVITMAAAAAIATTSVTSIIPMNDYKVYAVENQVQNLKLEDGDLASEGIVAYNNIRYTGKEMAKLPLKFMFDLNNDGTVYESSESVMLELGKDYKIVGYCKADTELKDADIYKDDKWTKGSPVNAGGYVILLEGMGNYSGRNIVHICIVDYSKLDNATLEIDSGYYRNSKDINLSMNYFDAETGQEGTIKLTEGKDYTFDGWCKESEYEKTIKNKGKVNWSKKKISETDYYYLGFTGIGQYAGQTFVENNKIFAYNANDLGCHNFEIGIQYNYNTKKYEYHVVNKNFVENRDYSVKYCLADEDYDTFLESAVDDSEDMPSKTIAGFPKKDGRYYVFADAKGKYKGHGTEFFSTSEHRIEVLKKNNLEIDYQKLAKNIYVAICPSKTKEYTITNVGDMDLSKINANVKLYDEAHECVAEYNCKDDKAFELKAKLEAGRSYYMDIETSVDGQDDSIYEISTQKIKFEINNGYKYRAPKVISDKSCKYRIIKAANKNGKNGEVSVISFKKKSLKKIKVANTVKINGKRYKVTFINKNAFKNEKKVKQIVIGKNVNAISTGAFAGCKNLKKIYIKSKAIKSIEKKAFDKNNGKKITVKVPTKQKKAYKKLFKKAGFKGIIK